MAFHPGPFDHAVAAAAGNDRALEAQLRTGFVESVERQIDLMRRGLADQAAMGVPGDPHALREISDQLDVIRGAGSR